jgi:hypothetical protein
LIYIGRIDLDNAEIEDINEDNAVNLLSAWRLYDLIENKMYLFSHRTSLDKMQMMDALEYERVYVEESLSKGFELPPVLKTQQYLADQSSIPTKQSTKKTI